MALLTPMTLEEAKELGRLFGLAVEALRPIPKGSVNSNFELGLSREKSAFLRVCEESNHDEVVLQNRLLRHLVDRGVPTPAPMERLDGAGTVAEHAGKPVAVFPFCAGDSVCQRMVDEPRLRIVGDALAAIHLAGEGFVGAMDSRFGPVQLAQRIADLRQRELSGELSQAVSLLADRLDETSAVRDGVEVRVIHGDVFRDNVLWLGGGRLSALLDFESASLGNPAFDLMVTMLAWCFGDTLEQRLARALLAGYQARRPLAAEELAACYDEARAAAVRFAITRITDYELRPEGVVIHKDYRRFVARLQAIEGIGREAFAAWLTA